MADRANSLVRGLKLAAELRRLRLAACLTIDQVAARLECSTAKVSRIENGLVTVRIQDARELLDLYQTPDEYREHLLSLVRTTRKKGWWHTYLDVIPSGTEFVIGMEAEAVRIRAHAVGLVPTLVQTEQYARQVALSTGACPPSVVERRTQLVLARQHILTRPASVLLHLVIDESALRRRIEPPGAMAQQYRHLIDMAELDNITIQLLPFTAGLHRSAASSFTIISFAESADLTDPTYVYTDPLTGYEQRTDISRWYLDAFDQASRIALDPENSAKALHNMAECED